MLSHPRVYDSIGEQYRQQRVPDPRIARQVRAALGDVRTVCNVGAGAGSYEPHDLKVIAVEPSVRMIAQRDPTIPVIRATAEHLPFGDKQFDASLAVLTVHHWTDPVRGLREMQRVSGRQVILTFDPALVDSLWLVRDYLPEVAEFEASRAIPLERIRQTLGECTISPVLIPDDCTDGFQAAYWKRPERYLDPEVRRSISTLSQLPAALVNAAMARLAADIDSGAWSERYASLHAGPRMDFGYRLVVADG